MKKKARMLNVVQVRLTPTQTRILDSLVLKGTYYSRSQAIRRLVAKQLKEEKFNLEEWI